MKIIFGVVLIFSISFHAMNFASEPVNCEELAHHIQQKINGVFPRCFLSQHNNLMVGYKDGTFGRRQQYGKGHCKWTGELNSNEAEQYHIDNLSFSCKQFEQYQKSLMKCIAKSTEPNPKAQASITQIQQQKNLISRCIALRQEGSEKQERALDLYDAQQKAQEDKKKKLDAYIKASDKE